MNPLFTQIGKTPQDSLIVVKREVPYFDTPFHFHPECELVYILSGSGKRIIGDKIEVFGPGDMIFLGPNIPHVWYSDSSFYKNNSNQKSVAIVVYFSKEIFSEKFFQLEETQLLKEFLNKSGRDLRIQGNTFEKLSLLLPQLIENNGMQKIVGLMQVLECLAVSNELESMASITYKNSYDNRDNHKIDKVFLYLNKNFMQDISMPEVAELCHMTPQSFCRFFKARTKTTFIDFLNDIRISHARKLLIESEEQTIAEIAYHCGYKNLSNFNKLFKIKTKLTPKEYKRNAKSDWIKQL